MMDSGRLFAPIAALVFNVNLNEDSHVYHMTGGNTIARVTIPGPQESSPQLLSVPYLSIKSRAGILMFGACPHYCVRIDITVASF